jgi:hypothetical protein
MIAKNEQYQYKSIPDAFKKIINHSGFKGLYQGFKFYIFNYTLSFST